jgi:hypothetical protein
MITKIFTFLSLLLLCSQTISARAYYSEDRWAMNEMTKSIGPHNGRTLYFIRPNGVIPTDSITAIIKNFYKSNFDSILAQKGLSFNSCGYYPGEHEIKHYHHTMFLSRLLKQKRYLLEIYVDTTAGLIAISSDKQKCQYGFLIEDQYLKNNRFANNVKDRLIKKYTDAEYIGCTKMKYRINESDFFLYREGRFWKWFRKYEKYLFDYEKRPEIIDKYLSGKLYIMSDLLSFKIGPVINGTRELTIFGPEYMRERIIKTVPRLRFWRISFSVK